MNRHMASHENELSPRSDANDDDIELSPRNDENAAVNVVVVNNNGNVINNVVYSEDEPLKIRIPKKFVNFASPIKDDDHFVASPKLSNG